MMGQERFISMQRGLEGGIWSWAAEMRRWLSVISVGEPVMEIMKGLVRWREGLFEAAAAAVVVILVMMDR